MPLNRNNLTRSSRVMLPTYALVNLLIGLIWTFQDSRRTNPGLAALREYWPLPATGIFLLLVSALMASAFLIQNRDLECMALLSNMFIFFALGVVFTGPLQLWVDWRGVHVGSQTVSISSPVLPFAWGVANMASFLTVFFREGAAE